MLHAIQQAGSKYVHYRISKWFKPSSTNIASVTFREIGLKSVEPIFSGTMLQVKEKIIARLGLDHGYEPIPRTREHLLKYTPKIEDLPIRSMKDSFASAIIPLSTDKFMQDKYVTNLGRVRLGRLMEDIDLFAVWICHQHIKVPLLPEDVHLPYTFVTILVDKITFSDEVTKATEDIRLVGHVCWVGRSSMEIIVWIDQKGNGSRRRITQALFVMAARNATNSGAVPVNSLQPDTDEEKTIFGGAEQRRNKRKLLQAASIFKVQPNHFEYALMYELFKRTTPINTIELNKRILPGNSCWMSESSTSNTVPSFPENRNAHNTVFGGFLMRIALEIGWTGAYLHCRTIPKLEHVCDISFEKPVAVAAFIRMNAYVLYTEANYIQMMASAQILDGATGEEATSTVFYFTFMAPYAVPEVLPRSYHETMWYLQGRRKFRYALGIDEAVEKQ